LAAHELFLLGLVGCSGLRVRSMEVLELFFFVQVQEFMGEEFIGMFLL
jgi:hypothetical protein